MLIHRITSKLLGGGGGEVGGCWGTPQGPLGPSLGPPDRFQGGKFGVFLPAIAGGFSGRSHDSKSQVFFLEFLLELTLWVKALVIGSTHVHYALVLIVCLQQ